MAAEAVLQVWQGEGAAAAREVSPERATDFALAQRAAAGDMEAFEEIFRRNHRLVSQNPVLRALIDDDRA